MATNPPGYRCMFCEQPYEYEVGPDLRPPGAPMVFGPTNWVQKPHDCPPGAVEAWTKRVFNKTYQCFEAAEI